MAAKRNTDNIDTTPFSCRSRTTVAGGKQAFIPATEAERLDRQPAGTYISGMVSAERNSGDFFQGADVDKLVLATVNAPYKRDISGSQLAECLRKADAGDWLVHVATFFTDVRPGVVLAFAESHGISKDDLVTAYSAIKTATRERNLNLETVLEPMATVA